MTEAELFEAIRDAAKVGKWALYHTRDSRRSQAGFPDLVLVRGERVIFAELKTETGRLTIDQRDWIDALEAAGQDVRIWRPADLESVLRELVARERVA